jgi:hypothetical protein
MQKTKRKEKKVVQCLKSGLVAYKVVEWHKKWSSGITGVCSEFDKFQRASQVHSGQIVPFCPELHHL